MNFTHWVGKYKDHIFWFFLSGVLSFLPTISRFVVSTFYHIDPFDIKDVLLPELRSTYPITVLSVLKIFRKKPNYLYIHIPDPDNYHHPITFLADGGNKNSYFH